MAIVGGTPRGLEKVLETYQKVAFLTVRNGADQDAEIDPPGGVQIWPLWGGPLRGLEKVPETYKKVTFLTVRN